MPPKKRNPVLRATASDEEPEGNEGDETIIENNSERTMEERVQHLEDQLDAEERECLRLQALLDEATKPGASTCNSTSTAIATSTTTTTATAKTFVVNNSSSTLASSSLAPFYSASTSVTPCIATSNIATLCTTYSWPQRFPSSVQSYEPLPTSLVSGIGYRSTTSSVIPTFLPPLTSHQNADSHRFLHQSSYCPQPQAVPQPSPTPSGFSNHRKLHDLPEFHGRPEEWPMFCTSFLESTNMFGYSLVENMIRLQKSIKGDAREVIESLLIHPNNVDQIMSTLEVRFGRPECLIQSQLKKVREFGSISESKLELIIQYSTKVKNLTAFLEASGMQQYLASPTLLDELVSKLPMSKRLEWVQYRLAIAPLVTIKHFNDWLDHIARIICVATTSSISTSYSGQRNASILRVSDIPNANEYVDKRKCRYCKERQHPVTECPSFTELELSRKWEFTKNNHLCFGCLKFGHGLRVCRSKKTCGVDGCVKKHHQLLHENDFTNAVIVTSNDNPGEGIISQQRLLSCEDADRKILFRVLPVRVHNGDTVIRTFALFDEGSSVTIISSDLAMRLRLNGKENNLNLRWVGREALSKKSFAVNVEISADHDFANKFMMFGVQTVQDLCLPTQSLGAAELSQLSHNAVPVAEYHNARPEILIGLDNIHLGAPIETSNPVEDGVIAARTKLGWVVYGKVRSLDQQNEVVLLNDSKPEQDMRLDRLVEDYFNIENFGVKIPAEKLTSSEEKRALQLLSTTTMKVGEQYQTGLLWKKEEINLPDSYNLAKRRLFCLEAKMKKNPSFAEKYRAIINNYISKGYASKLTQAEVDVTSQKTWYLPHFGVQNPNKPEKVRLVFDAAAEVSGISLNSFLLKGPDDYVPLVTVLYNFRLRPVAVAGDIREMFHQILIRPEDQNSQRFLWRPQDTEAIGVYVMRAMTFGASCSPCSANYIKDLNASKFKNVFPRAVKAIICHHYVDDYVDSFEDVSEAIRVTKDVIAIHKSGGFELRNFVSNSKDVLRKITNHNGESLLEGMLDMDIEGAAVAEKVLGMCWDSTNDVFVFRLKFPRVSQAVMMNDRCPTKREFLSITMSIFDPFGMISNFVLPIKLLLRSVWRFGVEWDQPIPDELFVRWKQWKAELPSLVQLKIPRCHYFHLTQADKIELHTFVDASEDAFSAVTYLRIKHNGEFLVSFICGKTRGAPKKLLSIPRLELSAAVLGTRLHNSIVQSHDLKFSTSTFWSDSKTVLHWLRADPRRNKEFVAFRIAEILESCQISQWRWIPSKLNPADEATRAQYPPKFQVDNKWINGPSFLKLDECDWPQLPTDIMSHDCEEELRPKYVLSIQLAHSPIFNADRFSSILKLQRTIAYLLRYINNLRRIPIEPFGEGEISAQELRNAERFICRQVQKEAFNTEIDALDQGLPIEKGSKIFQLTPYLDKKGLLRVLGRIDAARSIPFSARRPIILPQNHPVTKLFVEEFHDRLRHQNDETIVSEVRQRFWVPNIRSVVKKIRKHCPVCRFRSAQPVPPLMGQLPEDRLTPFVRPFTYTGLDYFGPINVTIHRRTEKRWIALFTCMTVRAVHLEIAADLSTDACIICIRNFVNRRGVPLRIRSDNGTNFVGASKELLNNAIFDNEAIKAELSSKRIEWVFNCPSNPHAGGCWERLVQSIKRVLSFSLQEINPKLETLYSALLEAENIVNSRPLTHLPLTVEDEEPLTPNHFLLGVPNSTQSPGPVENRALCLRKQWKVSQQLKNRFWKRWMREYLPVLTKRCKWFEKTTPLKEGDLVLVCDVQVPRSQWIRGRITKVFPGVDGQVRSAEVRTKSGVVRRPAVKLAKLEVGDAS